MTRKKKSRSLRTLLLKNGINLRTRSEDRHARKSDEGASNRLTKHRFSKQKSVYEKWRLAQEKNKDS